MNVYIQRDLCQPKRNDAFKDIIAFLALFKRKLIEIRSLISTLNESFKLIRWYKSF